MAIWPKLVNGPFFCPRNVLFELWPCCLFPSSLLFVFAVPWSLLFIFAVPASLPVTKFSILACRPFDSVPLLILVCRPTQSCSPFLWSASPRLCCSVLACSQSCVHPKLGWAGDLPLTISWKSLCFAVAAALVMEVSHLTKVCPTDGLLFGVFLLKRTVEIVTFFQRIFVKESFSGAPAD